MYDTHRGFTEQNIFMCTVVLPYHGYLVSISAGFELQCQDTTRLSPGGQTVMILNVGWGTSLSHIKQFCSWVARFYVSKALIGLLGLWKKDGNLAVNITF